jgi:AbrB family looped-hinge helix DNA binding protein
MPTTVEIDKAGRIVVPKKLRDELHLTPGTRLTVERSGDRLVLEQEIPESQLILKDGLWALAGGAPTSVADANAILQQAYAERHARIMEGSGLE